MRSVSMILFLVLGACGADGPPEPVEEAIRIDATTSVGVTAQF